MKLIGALLLGLGSLVCACAEQEPAPEAEGSTSSATTQGPLPRVGGDASWLVCQDSKIAITAYERRGKDGASRPLTVSWFSTRSLHGTSPDILTESGDTTTWAITLTDDKTQNVGGALEDGKIEIDHAKHTARVTGSFHYPPETRPFDTTLPCRSLGSDYTPGPIEPNPDALDWDFIALQCDSAPLTAAVYNYYRFGKRVTEITLVAEGHAVVFGKREEPSSGLRLESVTSAKDSFDGSADIDFTKDRITLKGSYEIEKSGTWEVDQTIQCRRLSPAS